MTARETADRLAGQLTGSTVNLRFGTRLEIRTGADRIGSVLVTMKSMGFEHLSNVTCVDWIEENRFEVVYNVWSYSLRVHAVVKVPVDRQEAVTGAFQVPTVMDVWPQAQAYEREIHEMFGVSFSGNRDLSPLFLHNWRDKPPLRKDFDSEEYSRRAYGVGGEGEGGNP
jgi:NADH-quinone oxidoreductase subunit C